MTIMNVRARVAGEEWTHSHPSLDSTDPLSNPLEAICGRRDLMYCTRPTTPAVTRHEASAAAGIWAVSRITLESAARDSRFEKSPFFAFFEACGASYMS